MHSVPQYSCFSVELAISLLMGIRCPFVHYYIQRIALKTPLWAHIPRIFFFYNRYLEVGLLNKIEALFILIETAKLFFKVADSIYTPINSV